MKNQIIWTFQHYAPTLPSDSVSQGISYTSAQNEFTNSFVAVSPNNGGGNGFNLSEAMGHIYRLAYERTQAQQQEREAELQRFAELLEDVNLSDSVRDS